MFSRKLNSSTNFVILLSALLIMIVQLSGFSTTALAQSQILESEPLEIITPRGSFKFDVEVADEAQERTIGLMNREKLDARGGMLFVFDQTRTISMWMKNTLIPLDMIFIAEDGTVINVAERTIPHSLAVITSEQPAAYVLELKGGMSALIGLASGHQIKHRLFGADAN